MGRVMELHPGKDGYTRVVTLKTKSGYMKRPVIKLSRLISEEDTIANKCSQTSENQEKLGSKQTNTRSRTVKNSFFSTMLTTFLLFMTIITNSEANVNITKFRVNQSLYFDKVANMLLIKDEWKLVVYYQMEPYWQGNKALDTYIQTLDQACKTMRDQVHCEAVLIQLRHGYTELNYYNQLFLNQQNGEHVVRQRRRRGLINGVGYLANSLFGVLDARFAEQYEKDIKLLQDNQKHIMNLWRNQTSVVESENNLLKRTENVMNQQHKIINQHMITLEKAISDLKNKAQANSIINDFAIGSIIASNVLHNLKNLQNTLLDTVSDIYQGRSNLHLLTPDQLINELSTIASKLPKDVSLPVDNIHSDLRKLYNLIKIKTRILQEFLLFEIRIPLISRETYEILKIFPIPHYQGNRIIKLTPVSNYVAMNIKKDTFIPMSEVDVQACFVQSETYFCHSIKPEYKMKSDKNLCEMENQECKTEEILCKNTWQDSFAINTYIYTCCERCQVRTMCEDRITAYQLVNSGLISVGHGCLIKTDEFTIYPHKPHTSEVRMSANLYTPTMAPINHIINISIPHLNMNNKSHLDFEQETSIIENKLQKLKESEGLSYTVSYHDIHHYVMIYVVLSIIAVIGIVIIIKRMQCSCRRVQTSAPDIQLAELAVAAAERSPHVKRDTHAAAAAARAAAQASPGAAAEAESAPRVRQQDIFRSVRYVNKSTSPELKKCNEIFKDDSI